MRAVDVEMERAIMNRIVVRIKGGLGNQLFCYASARRLALVNNAELVIDDVTGFARDHQYQRFYQLEHFKIPCRKATPFERLEPVERYRRGLMKILSRKQSFESKCYLEQEGIDFDARLLERTVNGVLYLDGLWQSEGYFKDVEQTIREELQIIPPSDAVNQQMVVEIKSTQSVALHVRWFDSVAQDNGHNVSADYYKRAIAFMEEKLECPHYFLFSDDPTVAQEKLTLPAGRVTLVVNNQGDEHAYADLWLMSQCQHFITANSTFSWWGAWLRESHGQIVVAPGDSISGITSWGFAGLIPDRWRLL